MFKLSLCILHIYYYYFHIWNWIPSFFFLLPTVHKELLHVSTHTYWLILDPICCCCCNELIWFVFPQVAGFIIVHCFYLFMCSRLRTALYFKEHKLLFIHFLYYETFYSFLFPLFSTFRIFFICKCGINKGNIWLVPFSVVIVICSSLFIIGIRDGT